ncbi:hypothetical protein ACQP2T_06340 [Nonomuraea sp. CA-143628]|uniref:hypothetical protein n=1 Tax=Nonomuraea sp. CA-143628 TaxID=3239997 RepID=UPI003D8D59EB
MHSINRENVVSARRRKQAAVVAALSAAVLVVGGGATMAVADGGGPAAGHTPAPVASSGGPTLDTPTTPDPSDGPPTADPLPEPTLGAIPVVTSRTPMAMPLDPVMTSLSDIALLDKAGELKATDCMHSLGFTDWTPTTLGALTEDKDMDPLGYLPPADVAQSGYPSTFIDRSSDTNASQAVSPSSDALRAYLGGEDQTAAGTAVPAGGCAAVGDTQLKGSATVLPVDPRMLAGEAMSSAMRDSRMQAVFASWSACMAGRGFQYDTPFDAQNDSRWGERTATTVAGTEEKSVAAADAACEQAINLVGHYKAVETAYQKQLLDAHRSELTTALSIFNTWVSNAKSIIAAH